MAFQEGRSVYIYYFVVLLLSLGAFYSISSFFNLFVLYYHYTHAPHPKFIMLPQRRLAIYTHIISGVTEFITCWIAFVTGNERIATIASLAAIVGHVSSAYYQTSIVFVAKALMVSGYLFAISLHLFCALNLYFAPSSVYWLLNMFLVHNIYVWCRVFYFFYGFVGLFKDTLYTNSILTSGLILFPAVLGVSANMLFLGYVALSIVLYFAIVQPNQEERVRFVSERTRDLLVNSSVHKAWINEKIRIAKLAKDEELTDRQQAKLVFDQLDYNKNGTLDYDEVCCLLKEWAAAEGLMKRFSTWSKKGDIHFNIFYNNIWRLGTTSVTHRKKGDEKQGLARAKFVFDNLDHDQSGFIDLPELQKLLIQWGLPDNEVDDYLAYDDDKRLSFEEFYQNLQPIWEFAFENMGVANAGDVTTPPKHNHSE
ncbi:unnamed protein product [Adineta ricciae]|uniref:EF-hand domain-containing protein n=1 Tax=Adineta ricciae TaxID=249248 RepID=A0A815I342_ADIRI|nr:unnamed protein product [Adineta ricciae]CAF1523245.1 unnamed protein product [Adineta ricciae]